LIVALLNIAQASQLRGRLAVFQIAYDEQQLTARAEKLRQNVYEVVSVVGNETAEIVLSSTQHSTLFIVGHAAPERTRKETVDWLKAKYPHVKILALNSADHRQLAGADYNTILTGLDE
jgi:DNA-binding NarL/FixJ family response regulator